jgi:hypothetical protein
VGGDDPRARRHHECVVLSDASRALLDELRERGPTLALGLERLLLARLERGDRGAMLVEKREIVPEPERLLAYLELHLALQEVGAVAQQLAGPHGVEADLIEEAQEPRLPWREVAGLLETVPHRDGAADELVAARSLHAVDAEVRAADADGVLRRPGAGRIVLGRDEAVARIDRVSPTGAPR